MPPTKISALTDGSPAQANDVIPIVRSGANYSVKASSVAALGPVSPLLVPPYDLPGQTGNASGTVYTPTTQGVYRVTVSLICRTAGSAGQVGGQISWNNGSAAQSLLTDYLQLSSLGELSSEMGTIYCAANQPITFSTTVQNVVGNPTYDIHIRVEFLG